MRGGPLEPMSRIPQEARRQMLALPFHHLRLAKIQYSVSSSIWIQSVPRVRREEDRGARRPRPGREEHQHGRDGH